MLVFATMIECRIRQAAQKRGIKNPYQFARALAAAERREVESKDEVWAGRLWKDNPKPTLATLDRVLRALPGCEIGDILVYKRHKSLPAKAVKKRR